MIVHKDKIMFRECNENLNTLAGQEKQRHSDTYKKLRDDIGEKGMINPIEKPSNANSIFISFSALPISNAPIIGPIEERLMKINDILKENKAKNLNEINKTVFL